MVPHENLSTIKDDISRAKLIGIQESVWAVQGEEDAARRQIIEKQGGINALTRCSARVATEAIRLSDEIQGLVKAGNLGDKEDEVKALYKERIKQVQKTVELIDESRKETGIEKLKLEGVVEGIQRAEKASIAKFNGEAAKYERHQREEELDAEAAGAEAEEQHLNTADKSPADSVAKNLIQQKNAVSVDEGAASAAKAPAPKPVSKVKKKTGAMSKKTRPAKVKKKA